MKISEYTVGYRGIDVRFRLWQPESTPHAAVCILHGLGDHSGCFHRLAERYCTAGVGVIALDLYGNGKTGGRRGDAPSFDTFVEEAELLVADARKEFPGIPLLLYGHSMGGCVALDYVLRRKPVGLAGVIASSPWLDLPVSPRLRRMLAYTLDIVCPRLTLDTGVHTEGMTHDEEFAAEYRSDPDAHGKISIRLLADSFRHGRWALDHAEDFSLPLLIMHGSEDRVTDIRASRKFAERAGGVATFKCWEGARHTLHNETMREDIYTFTLAWIQEKTGRIEQRWET